MATDRVESSQSPEIALLWPLQEMSTPSTSDPAKTQAPSSRRPSVKKRKVDSPSSSTGRNRTSTARSSEASSYNSSTASQDPLYAHLRPQPQPETIISDLRESPTAIYPGLSQTSSKRPSQGEPYYFPDNLSDIVVSNTPITFEKAFSQQMKENRVGPASSSSRTLTQIPIGGFSTLSATGVVTSRQTTADMQEIWTGRQPSTASGVPQVSSSTGLDCASQRHVLAKTHLDSPVKRAAASTHSGLPTPPFSDVKRHRQAESEDEDMESELKDLKKATAKYGILTPPSSSTGMSNAQRSGARAETVDPFNAIYDDIEVESMSEEENQPIQAGRPLTHPKAREARMQALTKLKKSRVRTAVPDTTPAEKTKRRRQRSDPTEPVGSVSGDSDVERDTASRVTPPSPSLRRRKRPRIVPSSQPDGEDDYTSIRAENSRRRSVTPEHAPGAIGVTELISGVSGGVRGSQLDPEFLDKRDARSVVVEGDDEAVEPSEADEEMCSRAVSAAKLSEESEAGETSDDENTAGDAAESSPGPSVIRRRPRRSLLVSSQASVPDGDEDDETDADMPPHDHRSVDDDTQAETPDVDLSTMFDDDVEEVGMTSARDNRLKVKSEKSKGKQPDYDMTALSDNDDDLVPTGFNGYGGDNFVDLTEDDVEGDAYDVDKYERTQEPSADDDDQDSSVDDFDAFDWDPSQPIAESAPAVGAARSSGVPVAMATLAPDGEELLHPLRTISSLPEKLQHFYLTHWCRESTRKKGLIGTEAQLANDKFVQEEMEAASDKRSGRGKTWANTVAARSGRGGAGASASTRGGRGAARGKAFFIQRAMRAKRASRGRGRG